MKTLMKILLPALVFSFVCAMAWFCAWIGGVKPFTSEAGLISFVTCFSASYLAIGASGVQL